VDKENAEIILYSTREASNHKGNHKHGLQDFLTDIHTVFAASSLLTKITELPSYSEYKSIINAWKSASGLDEETFGKFLRHLRFELNQDDLQRQQQNIITKLALLGIDERFYDTLLNAVVDWSISGTAITKTDVLKKLGIAHRLIDTVAHDYGVEKSHYIENTLRTSSRRVHSDRWTTRKRKIYSINSVSANKTSGEICILLLRPARNRPWQPQDGERNISQIIMHRYQKCISRHEFPSTLL
jgi:hypothetical protein